MAREYAPVKVAIWSDDDFRKLTIRAQHLYFLLMTSPTLSHAGVADWRPNRIAALAYDWSVEDVIDAAEELEDRLYVVIDWSTEEVLIRSFVRHDGLMKQPKMAVSMANAHAGIASTGLRAVIVHELRRLKEDSPELNGWGSGKAMELLIKGSVDPSTYPLRKGSGWGSPSGSVSPNATPKPEGSVKGSPSPAPTPAPTTSNREPKSPPPASGGAGGEVAQDEAGDASQQAAPPEGKAPRSDQGTRIPEDWQPSHSLLAGLREKYERPDEWWRTEHEKFVNHFLAKAGKDARRTSWSRTFTNWIHEAIRRDGGAGARRNQPARKVSEGYHAGITLAQRMAEHDANSQLAIGGTE